MVLERLDEMYAPLPAGVEAIEYVPLRGRLGVGALVFMGARDALLSGEPLALRSLQGRIQRHFAERLAKARTDRDEFELRHMAVARFLLLAATPARTRKGNIAHARIEKEHASVIEALRADVVGPGVTTVVHD